MAQHFPVGGRGPSGAKQSRTPKQSNHRADARSAPTEIITSKDNKWLKIFRAALRGTGPASGEPIGVEGPKLIEEAVRSGLETEALLLSETSEPELARILQAESESEAGISRSRILRTTDKLFAGVAGTETPQGVAALFRQRQWQLEDVLRGRPSQAGAFHGEMPLVLVMAGIQDPGNVGTMIRSAEAFGATGVVAMRGTADPWSPKALRASAGSALRLPLLRGIAIPILLTQLRVNSVKIFAAKSRQLEIAERSEALALQPDLRHAAAIFVGSEGAGLPTEIERAADDFISIPISDDVDSLNAGVAASVILFEAARQRRGA